MIRYFFILSCMISFTSLAKNEHKFTVGNYGLHFNQRGEIIKPDEYYTYLATRNEFDDFKIEAVKNFKKAASYGNTFAIYYVGLLYLQEKDYINGYAWLSMVPTEKFPFADNTINLLNKLNRILDQQEINQVKDLELELLEIYGVEPTYLRRLAWSKNFKLTGTNIRGYIPPRLSIQTDFSHGIISRLNTQISSAILKKSVKNFVYEYELDYRLKEGEVKLGEIIPVDSRETNNKEFP